MIYKIVSVKDLRVDAFMPITCVQHVGAAIRQFNADCNKPDHHLCIHSVDFALYELGFFDDNTGEIGCIEPKLLSRATDAKVPQALAA